MWKEISPEQWEDHVFQRIGKQWMLISAEHDEGVNAMTASWGGMGVLWNKPVAFIYVRPQRFTKTLLDVESHFALTFYPEKQREMLAYMGKVSGRDEDKIAHAHLHVIKDHAPYFDEAEAAFICRKLFVQELDPEGFQDAMIDSMYYRDKDYHFLYVGEIEKILLHRD